MRLNLKLNNNNNNNNNNNKAFTLAEILIVLSVIAIITAILLPAARNAMPNEDIVKFKKGHDAFKKAIAELVTSDKYYLDGDLGTRTNGNLIDGFHEGDYQYFCKSLAEVMNTKKVSCTDHGQTDAMIAASLTLEREKELNDYACTNTVNNNCGTFSHPAKIVTINGITFYEPNSKATFGMLSSADTRYRMFHFEHILKMNLSTDTFNYKSICMDIDDPCKGVAPFAFGLRVDGKIILSQRAREWLEKSIQEK